MAVSICSNLLSRLASERRPRSRPLPIAVRVRPHHLTAFKIILPTTVSGSPCTLAATLSKYRPAIGRSVLKA